MLSDSPARPALSVVALRNHKYEIGRALLIAGKSSITNSDFLNVSDTTQAEFAKIPIARVVLGAIQ